MAQGLTGSVERRLRALLEYSADGLLLANAEGAIIEVIHPILGYRPEEWNGASGLALIHPDDRNVVREAFLELRQKPGTVLQREYRVLDKNGAWRWLEAVGSNLLEHEDVRALVLNYRDITDRKNLQHELERRSEELTRSNTELEQFVHIASHDMQEPLRTIRNFSGLLRQKHKHELSADAQGLLAFVVDAASGMQELLTDLLAYSRLGREEAGAPEAVNTGQIVNDVLAKIAPRLDETGGTVSCEALPVVWARPTHVYQVMQNLITNGLKYARPDAAPAIHISAKTSGSEAVFSVGDNGIGIDPRYHERIFELFERLHGSNVPGTGIGLAICKRIVGHYGGRIWLESSPGQGSTFYFTLPCK
jgi:PAS domain S-box-containing protein